jgi:hypothetical protein
MAIKGGARLARRESGNSTRDRRAVTDLASLGEATKNIIAFQTDLANGFPLIREERFELRQLMLTVTVNVIEAMSRVIEGGSRAKPLKEVPGVSCSSPCEGRVREWRSRLSTAGSTRSTGPNPAACASSRRSAARSSKRTVGN